MHVRMFRHFITFSGVALGVLDGIFITACIYWMGIYYYASKAPAVLAPMYLRSPFDGAFWVVAIIALIAVGLYAMHVFVNFALLLNRMAIAFVIVLVFSLFLMSCAQIDQMRAGATNYPLKAALIWFAWVALTRGAFAATFELGLLKKRILVLGSDRQAARIAELVETGRNHHFAPVSFVGLPAERACLGCESIGWSDSEAASLTDLAVGLGASEVVVATSERRGLPVRQLLHCKMSGIKVTDFLDFWERETRTIDLQALKPSWLYYSDGFRCRRLDAVLKRCFDIAASLALLMLTLPVQAVTALLIRLESRGPVFYRQTRVGLHGREFTILKFRSMRVGAEGDRRPRWASEDDPRVTRVGAIIRQYRIDELPQLWNVLRGDMSFVGPRPERPFFVAELAQAVPYYTERHWVRPGITGWAQINYPYGASVDDARRKLSYDLYYVKNRSVFLDFVIVAQTARVVFSRSGAR
jgi:sugar transferase (PEP-CTERM system associated)